MTYWKSDLERPGAVLARALRGFGNALGPNFAAGTPDEVPQRMSDPLPVEGLRVVVAGPDAQRLTLQLRAPTMTHAVELALALTRDLQGLDANRRVIYAAALFGGVEIENLHDFIESMLQ